MGIDRDQIVKVAMYDYTHPADGTGLSDAYDSWRNPDAVAAGTWVQMDVAKANEMLDAAGLAMNGNTRALPDGTPISYDINVVSGWSDWVSSVQIIAKNLADLGIEAKVQTYDFAAYFDHLSKGDFDLSIWSGQIGPTPYTYYRNVMGSVMVVAVGSVAAQNFHRVRVNWMPTSCWNSSPLQPMPMSSIRPPTSCRCSTPKTSSSSRSSRGRTGASSTPCASPTSRVKRIPTHRWRATRTPSA